MNIYINLIIGALLFDIVLYGIKYRVYHCLLWSCKYTRIKGVLKCERILYYIRHIGFKIPFLIIRPTTNKVEHLKEEYRYATWKMEKLFIFFEIVINLLRYIIGIRPIYIICIGYWIWCNFEEKIMTILLFIWEKVIKVDYIGGMQTIYDYVVENVSGLLIFVLILIVIYNYYLKAKISKYHFEQIWANDSEKKVKEVAQAQKNIEAEIKKLYGDIWNNVKELKQMIDKLDRYYLYSKEEQFIPETCRLIEYYDRVERIKSEIRKIEECEGRKIYIDYNKKIWMQLKILSLTDSNNEYFYAEDIGDCDKKSIENSTNTINKDNYKTVRELWMMDWTTGISCLNGIERYLQYILARKNRFENIYLKIKSTANLKKILENMKELKEE